MGYKLILIDGEWKRFYGTMKEAREYLEKHKKMNGKRRIKK